MKLTQTGAVLAFIILWSILLHGLYYPTRVNFSADQGLFGLEAFRIWQNKEITLVGPTASLNFEGHSLIQGSISYYFMLIWLLLGQFNPVYSSFLFSIFSCFMIIPLYFGSKWLTNRSTAIIICLIYGWTPYFVDYTNFLWNPNFQIALSPLLIFFLGKYHQQNKIRWLLLTGIAAGILTMFHFQFLIVITFISLAIIIKYRWKRFFFFVSGYLIGFSPLLIFEIKNQFYNLQTLLLIIKNPSFGQYSSGTPPHYWLSIIFCSIIIISLFIQKYTIKLSVIKLMLIFSLISLLYYTSPPAQGFGMGKNWNYQLEETSFKIIKDQQLASFNVVNLIYETEASVQHYLIKTQQNNLMTTDYNQNQYLFIIGNHNLINSTKAYQVTDFKPNLLIKTWSLNEDYQLFLYQRQ